MKEHPTSGQGRQVTGFGHTASPGWQEGPSHTQAPEPAPGKLAFVLSGGGSLGSVQVGCIQALLQHGVFPDLVVGTSVGALNGVWLAKDPTPDWVENLKELWLSMGRHGPFRTSRMQVTLRLLMGREYLYANDFLRKLVCQYIGDTTFEDLQVPAMIVATNMETGEPAVLDRGSLELAVLASTAIAGVFPPVQIDGVEYVDGGMMSYCGLGPAWDHGARRKAHGCHRGPPSPTRERSWHIQALGSCPSGSPGPVVPPGGRVALTTVPSSGLASGGAPEGPHLRRLFQDSASDRGRQGLDGVLSTE